MTVMKVIEPLAKRKTGRPLSFDREAALHQAMLLFWRHGYEATSVSALTQAMGITSPSLYTAFGDKKGLFLEAVQRYSAGSAAAEYIIDEAATARQAAVALLEGAAHAFTRDDMPPGCLLASAAISCSDEASDIRDELAAIRQRIEARLHQKIVQAVAARELSAETDADALAAHTLAVIQGMSTLARDGASRDKLTRITQLALKAWPCCRFMGQWLILF